MATAQSQSRIRFDHPLVLMPGTGYGCTQPVAIGALRFLPAGLPAPDRLHRLLATALGEAVPIGPPRSGETSSQALGRWLLEGAVGLQRAAKIPVLDAPRVLSVTQVPDGSVGVRFLMPWIDADAARRSLEVLSLVFSDLLAAPKDGQQAPRAADHQATLSRLSRALATRGVSGTNTLRFIRAAHADGIPFHPMAGNVYAFGEGRHTRWMDSSFTDHTPSISVRIARQKHLAAKVLRENGFPVPEHALVDSADDAVRAAGRLGYPVVVKPADKDGGVGVTAGLETPEAVAEAYVQARKASPRVLVERHIHGDDHRLTICHGRMIKCVRRIPGGVTGDGRSSVAELIDRINADPVRVRRNASRGRTLLSLDDEALSMLAERGLDAGHVPERNAFIALRRRANISTGGEPVLVTHLVHPDNRRLAERAADALRLDMAGVDLILPDISRSWFETGAGICEVNAQPQIGEATTPEIFLQILHELLPESRIPVVLVLGQGHGPMGGELATRLRAALHARGLRCAISAHAGAWDAQGRQVCAAGDAFAAGRAMMRSDASQALIAVIDAQQLLSTGLPFDRCNALIIDPDDPGAATPTIERALSMAAPHVADAIVAPASLPGLDRIAALCGRDRLRLVALQRDDAALSAHLDAGGEGYWTRQGVDGGGAPVRELVTGARSPRCAARMADGVAPDALSRALLAVAALPSMTPGAPRPDRPKRD